MPIWVKGILIETVLDNIDEISNFLKREAKKTDNQLDDALVDIFIHGSRALLTALKQHCVLWELEPPTLADGLLDAIIIWLTNSSTQIFYAFGS